MDKLVQFITDNLLMVILILLGIVAPGIFTIFIFNRDFFVEIEILKLLFLSGAIGGFPYCSMVAIEILCGNKDDNPLKKLYLALIFNISLFSVCIFYKILHRETTSELFVLLLLIYQIAYAVVRKVTDKNKS